jgi:YHS domain-containing protein
MFFMSFLFPLFVLCSSLNAAEPDNSSQETTLNMDNRTCPVSGKQVNGVDSYVYNGKEYNLCSEGCKAALSQNPERYLSEENETTE